MQDAKEPMDCFHTNENNVYALNGATVLEIHKYNNDLQPGHIKSACNEYFNGRTCYFNGVAYNAMNARTLYRAMLWAAHKEDLLKKAFSTNIFVDCNYYPKSKKYALVNNTNEEQVTTFYDMNGVAKEYTLAPNELLWIE